jgi:hypothetical protein
MFAGLGVGAQRAPFLLAATGGAAALRTKARLPPCPADEGENESIKENKEENKDKRRNMKRRKRTLG